VKPSPVALAATLHDPTGALRREIAWGCRACVRSTPPSPWRRARPRRRAWSNAPRGRRLRRDASREYAWPALPDVDPGALRARPDAVHYLDFDRVLHWLRVAPREHRAIVRLSRKHRALLVGERRRRTRRITGRSGRPSSSPIA